jgi:hypothetical protein
MAGLTVFSEPPELSVYLDGKKIGTTPVWEEKVTPGPHVLSILDDSKSIRVEADKILKIGLFNGKFVTFPHEEKRTVQSPPPEPEGPVHRPAKIKHEEQKKRDIERWQRFITLGHF